MLILFSTSTVLLHRAVPEPGAARGSGREGPLEPRPLSPGGSRATSSPLRPTPWTLPGRNRKANAFQLELVDGYCTKEPLAQQGPREHMLTAVSDLSCYSPYLQNAEWRSLNTPPGLICSLPTGGLPFSSPGDLPEPGTEAVSPTSPALAGGFFTTGSIW